MTAEALMAYQNAQAEIASREASTALDLLLKGENEQAIVHYQLAAAAEAEALMACGRDTPTMVIGCREDDSALADILLSQGQVLDKLHRGDAAIAAFDKAIARFEPRWSGCESAEWGTKCARAAQQRRQFKAVYARFLKSIDRKPAALAVLGSTLLPRLEAIKTCAGDCPRADYALVSDYSQYHDLLLATGGLDAAVPFDETWLALLGRHGDGSTDVTAMIGEIADALAKPAAASPLADRVSGVLAQLGLGGKLKAVATGNEFAAELAEIEAERSRIGGFSAAPLAANSRRKLALVERQYGPTSTEAGQQLWRLALDLGQAGQGGEAASALERSLVVLRKTVGDGDFRTLFTLGTLAETRRRAGNPKGATAVLSEVLASPQNDRSDLFADPARAIALNGGVDDPFAQLNRLKSDLAALLLEQGRNGPELLAAARHAADGPRAYRRSLAFDPVDENASQNADADIWARFGARSYTDNFIQLADALWSSGDRGEAQRAEAFAALQEAMTGATSRAVAKAATDRIANRAGVAPLLAERHKLADRIAALQQQLSTLAAGTLSGRERERQISLVQDDISRQTQARARVDAAIRSAAPEYFPLVRPQALTIAQARALLAPDEAVLIVVPSRYGTHVMLVSARQFAWQRVALDEAAVNLHVRRLLWDVGANVAVTDEENQRWSAEGKGPSPFDRGTARLLYTGLIEPFAAQLRDTPKLFIASAGALASLPFGLMVAEPYQGDDGDPEALRHTAWLADRFELAQLPSLQTLQLLRAAPRSARAHEAMVGFGDPVLGGGAVKRGFGASGRPVRGGDPSLANMSASGLQSGTALAGPELFAKLARLPGTASELAAMRSAFGPANARVILAGEATETRVRHTDLTGLRVLAFATHGLLASQTGIAEPALVLTPPAHPSLLDDGLLTASEITGLAIDTDWAVLSACNTAGGDRVDGGPGLSGLARAFFFAGAESLLVSHWPLRDDVAGALTVRAVELLKTRPGMTHARALQQAMREVRLDPRADQDVATWAHPGAWAPFSLVGDGSR